MTGIELGDESLSMKSMGKRAWPLGRQRMVDQL